jgi:protein-disulfide isomerase
MGTYWRYHDRLFAEQPRFERPQLLQYAADLGLDSAAFARCLDEHRFAAAVAADLAEGRAIGVTGTPTFFINDQPVVGAQPVENFRAVIDGALRDKR